MRNNDNHNLIWIRAKEKKKVKKKAYISYGKTKFDIILISKQIFQCPRGKNFRLKLEPYRDLSFDG